MIKRSGSVNAAKGYTIYKAVAGEVTNFLLQREDHRNNRNSR